MSNMNEYLTTRRHLIKAAAAAPVVVAGGAALLSVAEASAQDATPPSTTTISTRVRILHAAPSLGKIEVHLNGSEKLDEFEYGDLSDWTDIDAGAVQVTVTRDRAGFNYMVFDTVYPVQAGYDYTLIFSDFLAITGFVDNSPIPDGAARVRFTQAAVDLPPVNVVGTGDVTDLATQLTYPRKSEYVVIKAGTMDVTVTLADGGAQVASVTGITLNGNTVYDLVIHGDPNSTDHPITITAIDAPSKTA